MRLSEVIQWGGCYDVEKNFERDPTVVLRTACAHYHLKNPSQAYHNLFQSVYRKIALSSFALRWTRMNPSSSIQQFFEDVRNALRYSF